MRRRAVLLAAAFLMGGAGACGAISGPEVDPDACPQTGEFGNYGCARVLVEVAPPPELPADPRWFVQARRFLAPHGLLALAPRPGPGENHLHVTLWQLPTDTMTVWINAYLRGRDGSELPLVASDSAAHLLRFAAVGEVAPLDTVRLKLLPP